MTKIALLSVLSTVSLCVALGAQKPYVVEASLRVADTSNRSAMPPILPLAESVPLASAGKPEDLIEVKSGAFTLGSKQVTVGVAKSDKELALPDLLLIDADGDGKIVKEERFPLTVTEQDVRGAKVVRGAPVDVALGVAQIAAKITFAESNGRASIGVTFPGYLGADLDVAGKKRVVCVLDGDHDGKYGSPGDLWGLATAGADRPLTPYALVGIGNQVFEDGHRVGVIVDGSKFLVRAKPADGPDPQDEAAQRVRMEHLWSGRFDKEREQFVAERKVDTSRPLAPKPIEWNYVTFDEALALGKKANKPVFVDVMAFWCVWCYRMDYYTYPDAEVAASLSDDFIPVKIIQEQARGEDYTRVIEELKKVTNSGGIPAMGVFSGDGALLHAISGWKAPVEFVTELKTALAKR